MELGRVNYTEEITYEGKQIEFRIMKELGQIEYMVFAKVKGDDDFQPCFGQSADLEKAKELALIILLEYLDIKELI